MQSLIINRNFSLTSKLGHRLIKFRYGAHRSDANSSGSQTGQSSSKVGTQSQVSTEAIWDFQLPPRWRRAPLTEEECAVINNGGPL